MSLSALLIHLLSLILLASLVDTGEVLLCLCRLALGYDLVDVNFLSKSIGSFPQITGGYFLSFLRASLPQESRCPSQE